MKLKIHKAGGLPFARKEDYEYEGVSFEADIKTGDVVTILDEGQVETGNYGEQTNFKIKTRNGDKKITFNQSTINVLIEEFGDDTENWIGKQVNVILEKKVIAGKKCIVSYFVTPNWELDDYGELVRKPATSTPTQPVGGTTVSSTEPPLPPM